MPKKLFAAQPKLLLYLVGAGTASIGTGLIFIPAGLIAAGLFMVALVVETGGKP